MRVRVRVVEGDVDGEDAEGGGQAGEQAVDLVGCLDLVVGVDEGGDVGGCDGEPGEVWVIRGPALGVGECCEVFGEGIEAQWRRRRGEAMW